MIKLKDFAKKQIEQLGTLRDNHKAEDWRQALDGAIAYWQDVVKETADGGPSQN